MTKNTNEVNEIKKDLFHKNKSFIITYVLWWFGGMLGLHRMYMGQWTSGIFMLICTVLWIFIPISGIIWVLDSFLNYERLTMINSSEKETNESVVQEVHIKEVKININDEEPVKKSSFKVKF